MRGCLKSIWRKGWALAIICLAILSVSSPAFGKSFELVPCVSKVRPGDRLTGILKDNRRFDCSEAQSHYQPGDYWVRMAVPKELQTSEMRPLLRVASMWDDGFTLASVHSDGSVIEYPREVLVKQGAMRLGPTYVVALQTSAAPISMLVARVDNSQIIRGVMLGASISEPKDAIMEEMGHGALYAGFGGLCIAMLVYTMVLWRAMRQPFLLAYSAMVVAMATYSFFTTGAIHYVVDGLSGADRLRLTTPMLAIFASSALIFVRHFFPGAIIPRWLVATTYIQAAIWCALGLMFALAPIEHVKTVDGLYRISFATIPLFLLAYTWTAWRQKDAFLKYFLIAWSAPVVSVIARTLYATGLLPHHMLIENSTIVAFAIEALVNSLAIGRRVWLIAQARDHAKNAEAIAQQMADTDPLTGLMNRRAFLRGILDRRSNWTLVLLDVDHFKRVNDTLGHAGGDEAIVRIAMAMAANAPPGALVARMGGEEFAIGYRGDLAFLFDADRLLASVRATELSGGYRVTASVGAASMPVDSEDDWKILYRAADMALYKAKSSGRNCFVRYQPERQAA